MSSRKLRARTGPGTVALVTGGGSGIGAAVAAALVARGGTVVVADVDAVAAANTARTITASPRDVRSEVLAIEFDVTDSAAFVALVDDIVKRYGQLDCLVNNAGIASAGEAYELTEEHWDRVLDVNLHGVVNGVRAAYPHMVQRRNGHIVNIASIGGLLPMPLFLPYNTSKFGVVGLSLGLRAEAVTHDVGVTVVCPGVIETPLLDTKGPAGVAPPPSAPDVRTFISTYMGRPAPADRLAARVIHAIERNRPMLVFPRRARLAAGIMRVAPRSVLAVTARSVRQEQKARA